MPELLRDRRLLLMLDNCEHVVEACAQLAEALLHSCPLVSVLATSRGFLQHRRRECLACPHALDAFRLQVDGLDPPIRCHRPHRVAWAALYTHLYHIDID